MNYKFKCYFEELFKKKIYVHNKYYKLVREHYFQTSQLLTYDFICYELFIIK